jgi:hypothetical protein
LELLFLQIASQAEILLQVFWPQKISKPAAVHLPTTLYATKQVFERNIEEKDGKGLRRFFVFTCLLEMVRRLSERMPHLDRVRVHDKGCCAPMATS